MGFCFFNNVVIAAKYWQEVYGRKRILICDWDAHHGNGIQATLAEDPTIFYVSVHEHPTFSFPGTGWASETGIGAGKGANLNVPLPPGADDTMILKALSDTVGPAVARFQPDAVIVAAGFDGHHLDDMSRLAFSTQLYSQLGNIMAGWARRYCDGRVVSILEGGYHLESLAVSLEKYLQGLVEGSSEERSHQPTSDRR
jgi:acetoin utilization deacetylase AcuC-like enzyme